MSPRRYVTLLARRVLPPGELRCAVWSVTDADRRRRRQTHGEQNNTGPNTLCVGGPVTMCDSTRPTCNSLICASWSRRCFSSVALRSFCCLSSSDRCVTSLADRFACSMADFRALALSSRSLCVVDTRVDVRQFNYVHCSCVFQFHNKVAVMWWPFWLNLPVHCPPLCRCDFLFNGPLGDQLSLNVIYPCSLNFQDKYVYGCSWSVWPSLRNRSI